MSAESPTNGEIRWRLDSLERVADRHDKRLTDVENEADTIKVLESKVDTLTDRVRVLTTALWSVVGGLVLLTISVLFAAGRLG